MGMPRTIAIATAGALVTTLLSGPSAAEWSRPRALDNQTWGALSPVDVAVDRNGSTVAAWAARSRSLDDAMSVVHLRRVSANGRMGALRTVRGPIEGATAHVSVAVDDDGDVLVTWSEWEQGTIGWQVWARRLFNTGHFGPTRRLSSPDMQGWLPQAALTPRGHGAVVFEEFFDVDGERQVLQTFSRISQVGPRRLLASSGDLGTHLVATRDGEFVTGGESGEVVAYRLKPDGRLASRSISTGTPNDDDLGGIGVDRHGNAYFTYVSEPSTGVNPAVWTRRWSAAGVLGRVRRISPPSQYAGWPVTATDLQGDTMIVWSVASDSMGTPLYSRLQRLNGTLGRIRRVGTLPEAETLVFFEPSLAIDDNGDGIVAGTSEPEEDRYVGWTRRVLPDGRLGPRVRPRRMVEPFGVGITPQGRKRLAMTTSGLPDRAVLVTGP